MAQTLRAIIKQAEELAENMGGIREEFSAPSLEILFPIVLRNILLDARKNPGALSSLKKSTAIAFVAGSANLPARAMPEYFETSELYGDDGSGGESGLASYIPQYIDFVNQPYAGAGIGSYTIKDGKILAKGITGETASPTEGTFNFYTVITPLVSSNPAATLDLDDGLTKDFIIELARAMRGEPPYLELGEKEKEKE